MPPVLADALAALSTLGGLGGLAALIAAVAALHRHEAATAEIRAEMRPDHGGSLRDAVDRIERGMDELRGEHRDLSRRLGHELGEVRRDLHQARTDHEIRLRRLERNRD
nr:MAG TPA: Protein of unknown function (DUF2746) [Caudoviricetes sp.]